MDTVIHLEYPERVITHTEDKIIVHDLNNSSEQIYPARSIICLKKLKDDLFLKIQKREGYYYHFSFLNGRMELKNDFAVNLQTSAVANIFPVLILDHYLVLTIEANMITSTCLIDIEQKALEIDPIIQKMSSNAILGVFQIGDEIISFERNYILAQTYCNIITIDTSQMKINCHRGYQELAEKIRRDVIAFKDGDGFIVCGLCRSSRSVILVNSTGVLLYRSELYHAMSTSTQIAYDEYTNSIMIKMVDESQNKKICRVYKQDEKWISEEMKREFNCTSLYLTTRKKILLGNMEEFIVCDKKTIEITSTFFIDQKSVAFYYDFYDKWFANELRRLLDVEVLGRMSRDILILILLYIS